MHVPAREIPVPTSISPEAQRMLELGAFAAVGERAEHPAPDDIQGWKDWVAAADAMAGPMMTGRAAELDAAVEQREIAGVTVNVVTPSRVAADDDRVVLELHGGALVLMGGPICTAMTALMAEGFGLRAWGPDYRMPPDHRYPAALDDCVAVYRALLEEAPAERVVVSGASAGGNLAAATVVRARDEGLPVPAAVVLQTPEVDLTESGDSFATNLGVDSILGLLRPVNELYADGHDLAHPYLSPLFADLTGFPPTILTTGTRDLFLSNTVRMHRALRRAGVEAELHVLEAAPHGGFFGMAPEDGEVIAEVAAFIGRHVPEN